MIAVPRALLATICRNAEATYPEECCGLLVGRDKARGGLVLTRIEPSVNLAADPRRRFEIDPALYLRLHRELTSSSERLIGLYHSHSDGPAAPSAVDAAEAWEEGWIWVIVPTAQGGSGRPTAHRLIRIGGPFEVIELKEI